MRKIKVVLPERGDRVKLRGRPNSGTLRKYDPASNWATVEWDVSGPKFCHRLELERAESGSN